MALFNEYLSMLVLLFRTRMFSHLFSMLCFSLNVIRARLMEQTNRDDHRTVQWNSSRLGFHLKIDFFKFMYRSNSLLEIASLSKSYAAEFENIFMSLMTFFIFLFFYFFIFFAITKDIVLFNIYFKSSIFSKQNAVVLRFEIVSDIILSV